MDFEKIQNVIKMLQSPDKENQIVGLTVIEQQVHEDNLVPLLFAYKFGRPNQKDWEDNALLAFTFIAKKVQIKPGTGITFNDIFEAIIRTKAPTEQMQMFVQMFGSYLTTQCKNLGYAFIDEIKIDVVTKKEKHVNI